MKPDKLFTLEEANALVPQLTLMMEKMQRINLAVREEVAALAREQGEQGLSSISTQQLLRLRPSLRPLFTALTQIVEEIEEHGCQFKGLELGLVDFPARIGGEVAYLCWQYGEGEIAFYHPLQEGFGGRRPLNAQGQKPRYYQ